MKKPSWRQELERQIQEEEDINSGKIVLPLLESQITSTKVDQKMSTKVDASSIFDPSAPTIHSYCASKGIDYPKCEPKRQPKSTKVDILSDDHKLAIKTAARLSSYSELGRVYGVSKQYISKIVNSK